MAVAKSSISKIESPPNGAWAVRLPSTSTDLGESIVEAIGHLRLVPGLQVHIDSDSIWLRGEELNDQISGLLRSLPAAERFLILPDDQLAGWGETIPRAKLPEGPCQPIAKWLSVSLPVAAFAARGEANIPFRLVRSSVPAEANLLRTSWTAWRDYATTTAQFRLNQLGFAASESEALIRGLPLPPLPGQRFVESGGVAIPVGWKTDPELDATSIRNLLKTTDGTIALLQQDGNFESIPDQVFVRASRSAVRMTDSASSGNSNAKP